MREVSKTDQTEIFSRTRTSVEIITELGTIVGSVPTTYEALEDMKRDGSVVWKRWRERDNKKKVKEGANGVVHKGKKKRRLVE